MSSGTGERSKPSYLREWLLLLAVSSLASGAYYYGIDLSRVPRASFPIENKERFLLLRLPEMSSNPVAASAARKRLEEWLTAIQTAGYNPVLLSRALAGVSGGTSLPSQAIAFVYDPGDRTTYEGISRILSGHRVPAAWITSGVDVNQHDLRYLSQHRLEIMKRSGRWDVGYIGDSTMTFTLDGKSYGWASDAGRYVLNGKQNLGALNRLNVNLVWTAPQLLTILRSMAPTQPSCLASGVLFGKRVGIVKPTEACGPADGFSLEAPSDAHSAAMFWRGASSIQDYSHTVDADSVVDELKLYLRYDSRTRRGLKVMFSPKTVDVMEVNNGRKKIISTQEWSYDGGQLVCSLSLAGRRLIIGAGNKTVQSIKLPEIEGDPGKNIVLMVYSKLRGAAQAKSLRLNLIPL